VTACWRAHRWQDAAGELAGATRRAPGKAVGGGAHPSDGVTERQWRMLRAAAFVSGEGAPVTDGIDGVALQCRGRKENVRGESIWTKRERVRSCSPIMADGGGARAGTREEEGSLVVGASDVDA
jgi:hypothetical protein